MAKEDRFLTISEAKALEFTHLHVQCDCRIVHIPWELLKGVGTHQPIYSFAKKLRCTKCGGRADPEEVYPTASFEAKGAGGSGPFTGRPAG